ncbi:uncharacterized protein LOC123680889 [Harmonia axyridis]|uniref:uncharacterized protein LOC123680889 n=1 Tax=Harmonia axyridis TaxID=115357 RepID=UPI001E277506|nr:uncharacterized protein LOC123680889 [Harmonia axyridis]
MIKTLDSVSNHEHRQIIEKTGYKVETLRIWKTGILKHSISNPSNEQLETFAMNVDAVLEKSNLHIDSKNEIRANCTSHFLNERRRTSKQGKETKENIKVVNNIKKKIRDNNLTVVKADKGSCMVILDRNLYINKVEEFMNENGFVKLDNNPTSRLINKVKNFRVSKEFEDKFGKYKNLIPSNPKIPKLYGLPKLHMDNIPIRPIVSLINTPVYKISKFLSDKLKDLTEFKPTYSIKNSGQLAESLKNLQIRRVLN